MYRLLYQSLKIVVLVVFCVVRADEKLYCTGPLAQFTYAECQATANYAGEGCYYLEHFMQYRPCSTICNNVTAGSIDQARCRDFCPDYHDKACVITDSTRHTPAPAEDTVSDTAVTETDNQSVNLTFKTPTSTYIYYAAAALIAVLIIVLVAMVYTLITKRKKRSFPRNQFGKKDQKLNYMASVEESDGVQLAELGMINIGMSGQVVCDEDSKLKAEGHNLLLCDGSSPEVWGPTEECQQKTVLKSGAELHVSDEQSQNSANESKY